MKQVFLQIAGIFALLAAPAWLIWQLIGWIKEVRKAVQKVPIVDITQRQSIEHSVKLRELKAEIDRLDRAVVQITNYLRQKK